MPGTVYLPPRPGPYPAVVCVHGGGETERLGGLDRPRTADVTDAAFVALASAPTVPERTANLYERLASWRGRRLVE